MWPNPQFSADLVTFTEQILNRKLHFLCSVIADFIYSKLLQWRHKNKPKTKPYKVNSGGNVIVQNKKEEFKLSPSYLNKPMIVVRINFKTSRLLS